MRHASARRLPLDITPGLYPPLQHAAMKMNHCNPVVCTSFRKLRGFVQVASAAIILQRFAICEELRTRWSPPDLRAWTRACFSTVYSDAALALMSGNWLQWHKNRQFLRLGKYFIFLQMIITEKGRFLSLFRPVRRAKSPIFAAI